MKKGFSLVELLGVIMLLGILFLVTTPIVMDKINASKKKAYQVQIAAIEKSASDWALQNEKALDPYRVNASYVSLEQLKKAKLLEEKKTKNPITGKEMEGCVIIEYQTNQYDYRYEEETCESLKAKNPSKVSIIQTILDQQKIYASKNEGLYESEKEYYFRGENPQNYLRIGTENFRIISIDKVHHLVKVIRTTGEIKYWQEGTDSTDFHFKNASIQTYLNSTYYHTIDPDMQKLIQENALFAVEDIDSLPKSTMILEELVSKTTFHTTIGLLNNYEYARASLDSACQENSFLETCGNQNYLKLGSNYWLMNSDGKTGIWTVRSTGQISLDPNPKTSLVNKTYPVFYLKASASVTGIGTQEDPYLIQK